jgi:hypothetical protein
MESRTFKRHEENPLDSLGIGRVEERIIERYNEMLFRVISDINKIAEGYDDSVKLVGREPISVQSPITGIIDPFYGFRIRLKISTFLFPSIEKVYDCNIEYFMESKIARMRWFISDGREELDKFGDWEECQIAFKSWLDQYCYRENDQRRYRIKYM